MRGRIEGLGGVAVILKAKLLVVYNTLLSIPVTLYLILWLLAALVALSRAQNETSLIAALVVGLIFLFVSSIYSAVRLKVRILKDIGDPALAPIQAIYKSASRVNLGAYAIYYPLFLSLLSPAGAFLGISGGVFLTLALVAAIPLRVRISGRARLYEHLRYSYALGRYLCPKCEVSLGFFGAPPSWVCFRCGTRF